MTSQETLRRYLENWQDEIDSTAEYHALVARERDPKLKRVYENLAKVEEAHIVFWETQLRNAGVTPGPRSPSWRSRVLIWIVRKFGSGPVISIIAQKETANRDSYHGQPETAQTAMHSQERSHARVLDQLVKTQPGGLQGNFLSRIEGRHRAIGGNALRASVLGANDGLCSNLSLVMGVAGASVGSQGILVTGIAGLLAGAFSMALGEWLSVTSSRELAAREIRIEADELEADPESEAQELQLIYESKGLDTEKARNLAHSLIADRATALDTLAREELGIDPNELGGSAWEAALFSFVLFALGAVIPVVPFLLSTGRAAILASLIASGAGLFLIGAAITIFTGRPVLFAGTRQLLLGFAAAGATFAIGRVLGVALGG